MAHVRKISDHTVILRGNKGKEIQKAIDMLESGGILFFDRGVCV